MKHSLRTNLLQVVLLVYCFFIMSVANALAPGVCQSGSGAGKQFTQMKCSTTSWFQKGPDITITFQKFSDPSQIDASYQVALTNGSTQLVLASSATCFVACPVDPAVFNCFDVNGNQIVNKLTTNFTGTTGPGYEITVWGPALTPAVAASLSLPAADIRGASTIEFSYGNCQVQ